MRFTTDEVGSTGEAIDKKLLYVHGYLPDMIKSAGFIGRPNHEIE
jgi:hypothetical protein